MTNLHDARVEAAVDAAWVKSMRFRGVGGQTEFAPPWEFQEVVRTALAAADAVVTDEMVAKALREAFNDWHERWWKNEPNAIAKSNALAAFYAGWDARGKETSG